MEGTKSFLEARRSLIRCLVLTVVLEYGKLYMDIQGTHYSLDGPQFTTLILTWSLEVNNKQRRWLAGFQGGGGKNVMSWLQSNIPIVIGRPALATGIAALLTQQSSLS